MRFKSILFVAVIMTVVLLLTGCGKAPQQEIDNAKAAIEAAKAVEADRYVSEKFNDINDSLNATLIAVEEQTSKFALFRDYGDAKKMLESITQSADEVRTAAIAEKEKVQQEVQQSLQEVKIALQEARALIAKAPKGKEGRVVLNAMQDELNVAESTLMEVDNLASSGDYLAARDKVSMVMEKVQGVNTELKDAIAKQTALKKRSM